MKGFIYLIENKINGKKYIGQTSFTINSRFKQHLQCCEKGFERPLYSAFRKYGIENFKISLIEKVEKEELSIREQFWIQYYNTYNGEGYNATLGGEGKSLLDKEKVIALYQEYSNMTEVARQLKCHVDSVKKILLNSSIKIINSDLVNKQYLGKIVVCYDILTQEKVKSFNSQMEAARWILVLNSEMSAKIKHIAANIGRTAKGRDNRTKAYGYIWKTE